MSNGQGRAGFGMSPGAGVGVQWEGCLCGNGGSSGRGRAGGSVFGNTCANSFKSSDGCVSGGVGGGDDDGGGFDF